MADAPKKDILVFWSLVWQCR